MITFNRYKESGGVLHVVLHSNLLPPIMYTKKLTGLSKYFKTVIHSIPQYMNCVRHSGCHGEITILSNGYLLKSEVKPEYKSLRYFFFQPAKSLMKAKGKSSRKV